MHELCLHCIIIIMTAVVNCLKLILIVVNFFRALFAKKIETSTSENVVS